MREFEFRCVCGEAARAPGGPASGWAALTGYGDNNAVSWRRDEAEARSDAVSAGLLERRPAPGEVHWARFSYPFAAREGESFWSLWSPPAFIHAGVDGGAGAKFDLRQYAFVRGRAGDLAFLEPAADEGGATHAPHQRGGIGRVTVEEVMTLDDIARLPLSPATPEADLWSDCQFDGHTTIARQGALVYVLYQTVWDSGFWAILSDTPEATDLLVFCAQGDHEDRAHAGRARLRRGDFMLGPGAPPHWLKSGPEPLHERRPA